MTEILSWNEQSGMYLVWFFPLPSVLVWLQKPFSILIKHAISKHCFQKHIGIGRGEQKFLFALLGDGIGICFLTNFGNFWGFEDFRILENIQKKIPKTGRLRQIFLFKKIISGKFLLHFAPISILSMTKDYLIKTVKA